MGWNKVNSANGVEQSLYQGLEQENRFYFVHSYRVECEDQADVYGTANYGVEFVCSVHRGNVYGAQFHPEKSHKFGMKFFENFLSMI
jgi:glutamine amidotransferase